MKAVDFKSIAMFFFFALLDEKKAIGATSKAIKEFRKLHAKKPEIPVNIHIIQASLKIWSKHHVDFYKGRQNLSFSSEWILPQGFDLNPWKEFQKNAPEVELIAVIWSKILKISEKEIAIAQNLSEGTLRYRIGKGLALLGSAVISPGENSKETGTQKSRGLGVVR